MKIARVFPNFQIDLKYTEHYLAKELKKEGHSTTFITSDKYLSFWEKYLKNKDGAGYYKYDDFDVYRLKAFAPLEKVIYKNPVKLYKLIFNSGYDILHLMSVGSFSTLTILFMSMLKGKKSPPIIISDHTDTRTHFREGFFAEIYYFFLKLLLIFVKGRIKKIITFSEVSINVLSRRFAISRSKFCIIPLGYDQDTFSYKPELKNREDKFIIGFAGKVSPTKRVDFLISALNEMDIFNKIKLIVLGLKRNNEYSEKLKNLSETSKTEIELRPLANPEALAEFYNYIDLAVFPGGISITTIEANSCGTPVVIYESIDKLEERVENGRGKLFKTKEEMLKHIQYYYDKYTINEVDNEHIANVTFENYSWQKIKNQYKEIYLKVIDEK